MNKILISIIVPVYNVSEYIERCIESIIKQTYTHIECFFINDCTPDDSIEKITKIISNYKGPILFKIINNKENKGLSASRNIGIRSSSGEYLYFLDSDDEISGSCIESLAKLASKYQNVEIVQGKFETRPLETFTINKLNAALAHFPEYTNNVKWIRKTYLADREIPAYLCNKLIKKEFILKNNLYNKEGMKWEDMFWSYKASKCLRSMAFSFETSYFYYINNPTSISHARDSYLRMLESYIVLIKECYSDIDSTYPEYQRKFSIDILKERVSFLLFNETGTIYIKKYIHLTQDIINISIKKKFISDTFKCYLFLITLLISRNQWTRKGANNIYKFIRFIYRNTIKKIK